MELGFTSHDDYPIPAGCPSCVTGIPRGIAGVGWCDAMVVLCLVLREVLGCASHQPSFSGVGPNASLPPTFPSLKESLKWVKSWHCLCFTWGHGFTPLVVGAKQPSCPLCTPGFRRSSARSSPEVAHASCG